MIALLIKKEKKNPLSPNSRPIMKTQTEKMSHFRRKRDRILRFS